MRNKVLSVLVSAFLVFFIITPILAKKKPPTMGKKECRFLAIGTEILGNISTQHAVLNILCGTIKKETSRKICEGGLMLLFTGVMFFDLMNLDSKLCEDNLPQKSTLQDVFNECEGNDECVRETLNDTMNFIESLR